MKKIVFGLLSVVVIILGVNYARYVAWNSLLSGVETAAASMALKLQH